MKILMTLLMLLSFNFALAEEQAENTFCNEDRISYKLVGKDESSCPDGSKWMKVNGEDGCYEQEAIQN